MPEIRFNAKQDTVAVIDGYCAATGRDRTGVINELLEDWAKAKLHEATVIMRVAGVMPSTLDTARNA